MHAHGLTNIPVAQDCLIAHQSQHLTSAQLRSLHTEDDGAPVIHKRGGTRIEWRHAAYVSGTVQMTQSGNISPIIGKDIAHAVVGRKVTRHGIPFSAYHLSFLDHHVAVQKLFHVSGRDGELSRPCFAVLGVERQEGDTLPSAYTLRFYLYAYIFSPMGAVIYGECKFHSFLSYMLCKFSRNACKNKKFC